MTKLTFWPLFALVVGSQIGSGIFLLPAQLAPLGWWSLLGWVISGMGALALSFVFAKLTRSHVRVGGPHAFVHEAWGPFWGFLTGWTYWVISWVSTTAVVITAVEYLHYCFPWEGAWGSFLVGCFLMVVFTLTNLRGLVLAGRTEVFLTSLKFLPLVLLPLGAFFLFRLNHLVPNESSQGFQNLMKAISLTMWGFVGLETATAPGDSVENAKQVIPRALLTGTLSVTLLYLLNSLAFLGALPSSVMSQSLAPYATVMSHLSDFSFWSQLIAFLSAIVCLGTLNAWILTSGQVALGIGRDGYLPACFTRLNGFGVPYWSLILSSLGVVFFLIFSFLGNLTHVVEWIIQVAVVSFLYVYLACVFAFFRSPSLSGMDRVLGVVSFLFCSLVLVTTPLSILFASWIFLLSGVVFYFFRRPFLFHFHEKMKKT